MKIHSSYKLMLAVLFYSHPRASETKAFQIPMVESEASILFSEFDEPAIRTTALLLVQNDIGHWPATLTNDIYQNRLSSCQHKEDDF